MKLKKFQVLSCGIMFQFHPYYGGLGKDLSAIESSFPSRYSRVEQCLPELKIRERFEKWLGFKIPCIVFELSDFSKVGYAVYRTSAKHTINKVIDIGSTLYGTCICAKEQNFKHTDYGDYSEGGIEYYILFDRHYKCPFYHRFIKFLHNISTHLLTVLTTSVIVTIEQANGKRYDQTAIRAY